MSQHDLEITNSDANTGIGVRQQINDALAALATLQSGSEPTTTRAYQLWADTANDLIKQRNSSNTAWVTIGKMSSTYWGMGYLTAANEFTALQKIKADPAGIRLYDTGGGGKEYCVRSNDGKIEICENTGTEGAPSWTVRVTLDSSGASQAANAAEWAGAAYTISASSPSGGSDGDFWFQYT